MVADSGQRFDQGRVSKILALIVDLNDVEFATLTSEIRKLENGRNSANQENQDTIRT